MMIQKETKFTLEIIEANKKLVGVNTHRANKIVADGLNKGLIKNLNLSKILNLNLSFQVILGSIFYVIKI